MGLRSFLFEAANPARRCLIFFILILVAALVGLWDGANSDLKKDGPTISLENKAILRQEFSDDTLCTTLRAGDSVKLLAIKRSSYGQEWLVETVRGDVGWIDAADLTHIRQVLVDGPDEGDTVNIKADLSSGYISNYTYVNSDGEENDRTTSDFVPVFDGWEQFVYNRGRVAGMSTQRKFEEKSLGATFEELNAAFGSPTLVHVMRDGLKVQYNWKAFESATGKMWIPNVTFGRDSVATAVEFVRPTDRAAGCLSILPLSAFIIDSGLTSLMVRGARYEPMSFGVMTTRDMVLLVCVIPFILLWGFLWLFGTSAMPVLLMGWLLKYPAVFKALDDKWVRLLMFVVMLLSCYVWSVVMMAWGMFPIFMILILMMGWYSFSLAKSPLCQFPHERCPHCRNLFTINFDHDEYLKTEYHTGRDIIKGNMLGKRTEKWKRWTEVTTTKTYKSGRTETYTSKENERTMARDYTTYEYLNYDVTYKVDTYRRYYVCDKCGFVEDTNVYRSKEVDRKYAGSHTSEIAGEEYEKPWYKS